MGKQYFEIPTTCPTCGSKAELRKNAGVEVLICTNDNCAAKNLLKLVAFADKPNLDIDGVSEKTIQLFNQLGILNTYSDFYKLPQHKDLLVKQEGFGKKAFDNLCESLEKSKQTEAHRLLGGLCIDGVGVKVAKDIMKHFNDDIVALMNAKQTDINKISGIGDKVSKNIVDFFSDANNKNEVNNLLNIILIKKGVTNKNMSNSNKLAGKTFCCTGKLEVYKKRDEMIADIEANGGVYQSSVNAKLNYLITNDTSSGSSKNQAAQKFGTKIITEQEFITMIK